MNCMHGHGLQWPACCRLLVGPLGHHWHCHVCRLLERPEDSAADAYEVVGLEPSAKASEIKKRYWRLSLLIHPDKCSHPRAHDAFQAVSKAAKQLQVSVRALSRVGPSADTQVHSVALAALRNLAWELLPTGPGHNAIPSLSLYSGPASKSSHCRLTEPSLQGLLQDCRGGT